MSNVVAGVSGTVRALPPLLWSSGRRTISSSLFVVARHRRGCGSGIRTTATTSRAFSTTVAKESEAAAAATSEATTSGALTTTTTMQGGPSPESTTTQKMMTLGNVVRHGTGDACITLNVGGTEFLTLRSTVASNAVLADHVARAEANHELTKSGAVFIDRSPDHFATILAYLRNRVELLSYNHSVWTGAAGGAFQSLAMQKTLSSKVFKEVHVKLPNDKEVLRDLYIEASYYRIPELQETLCHTGWLVSLAGMFNNGGGNPFDAARTMALRLRSFLVLFGGSTIVAVNDDSLNWVYEKLGLREPADDKSEQHHSPEDASDREAAMA